MGLLRRRESRQVTCCVGVAGTLLRGAPAASRPWEQAERKGTRINCKTRWKQKGTGRLHFQQVSISRWETRRLNDLLSSYKVFFLYYGTVLKSWEPFGIFWLAVKLSQALPFPGCGLLCKIQKNSLHVGKVVLTWHVIKLSRNNFVFLKIQNA